MKTCLLVLTALLVGAAPVAAQDPEIPVLIRRQDPDRPKGGREAGQEEGVVLEDPDEARHKEMSADGKVEHVEPSVRNDLSFYMSPVVSFLPRRIAPGAGGDVFIVLAMQRGVVLEVGKLELAYQREQGPIHLGEWSIAEPVTGSDADAFRGRPVYESYAKINIPLTVEPGASHGSYPVLFRLTAQVTDGDTGGARGESGATARVEVVVGPAMPNPAPPVARGGGDEGTAAAPAVAEPETSAVDPDPASAQSGDGAAVRPTRRDVSAPAVESDEPGAAGPVLPSASGGSSHIVLIGGGALLLMIILAVLGVRRR